MKVDIDLAVKRDGEWIEVVQYYTPSSTDDPKKVIAKILQKEDSQLNKSTIPNKIIEVDLLGVRSSTYPTFKLPNDASYSVVINFNDKTLRVVSK